MMLIFRQVQAIAGLYFRNLFNNPATFFFWFAMPVFFIFLLGLTTQEGGGGYSLALVSHDRGSAGAELARKLSASQIGVETVAEAQIPALTKAGKVAGVLVLPANFSANLAAGQASELVFHISPARYSHAELVRSHIIQAINELGQNAAAAQTATRVAGRLNLWPRGGTAAPAAFYTTAYSRAEQSAGFNPVSTHYQPQGQSAPSGFMQAAPGMMVMFAMLFMLGGTTLIIQEREQGTLARLLVSPVRPAVIILGKLFGVFTSGILQMLLLILTSTLLFSVNWMQSPLALMVLVGVFAFAITSFGMLVAALGKSYDQLNGMSMMLVMVCSSLGGAWWPLEVVPPWMRTLGYCLPTAWAMDGFTGIILRGASLSTLLPEITVLCGFGLTFLLLSIWRFKYQ